MIDEMKAWGGLLIAVVGGLIGYGQLRQRTQEQERRINGLEAGAASCRVRCTGNVESFRSELKLFVSKDDFIRHQQVVCKGLNDLRNDIKEMAEKNSDVHQFIGEVREYMRAHK